MFIRFTKKERNEWVDSALISDFYDKVAPYIRKDHPYEKAFQPGIVPGEPYYNLGFYDYAILINDKKIERDKYELLKEWFQSIK